MIQHNILPKSVYRECRWYTFIYVCMYVCMYVRTYLSLCCIPCIFIYLQKPTIIHNFIIY